MSAVLDRAYDQHGLTLGRQGNSWAVHCTCRSCGVQGTRTTGSSAPWPPARAAVIMKEAGWAERGGRWTCPACIEGKRKKKDILPVTKVVPITGGTDAPRVQTAEDKRLIRLRLDEVYDQDRGMYSGALNDSRLAEELGVPRAWVTAAREYLGEDRCEQQQISQEQLNSALLTMQGLEDDIARVKADAEAIQARLTRELGNVRSALKALQG